MTGGRSSDASPPPGALIGEAVRRLRGGGLVCFPTETFYGLAADALSAPAIERLLAAKGREPERSIALIVADLEAARRLWTAVPAAAAGLIARHWPGPLTVVLPARPGLPSALVGAGGGVGARVSSHPWADALARAFGGPITATSANRAGEPPARSAGEARAALGDRVDLYLDAGPTPGGPPSTIVAVEADGRLRVLRPGAIPIPIPSPSPNPNPNSNPEGA